MAAKRGSTYEVRSVRYQIFPEAPGRVLPASGSRSSNVVIVLDRDQKLVSATPSVAALFTCSPDEIVGRPLGWFLHPADREAITRRLSDIANEPGGCFTAIVRARTQTAWRPIELTAQLVLELAGAIAITFHELNPSVLNGPALPARTQAEDALEKLSLAIEQTADSVVITDRDGVIEYVNPAFQEMTGYSRHQVIGGNPRILQSGVHNHEFYERLWNTILSGRTFRSVMTNRRQDGSLYDEDQTITPIRGADGAITHFVSTGRDITHRKRSQEALQRLNQQLEREAARIAGILHDEAGQFLTSAHITLADLCEDAAPAVRERLLMVRGHLDHIEQRLREISHEIHPRIVEDLGLRDAVTFFAESFARRTGIAVSVDSALHHRYAVSIESLVYRFVQEGLTNISRHAHATSAAVRLTGNLETIGCSVRDDGIGFNPAALCGRGTCSLGLHVMQDRLEAVGGTLQILSAPGEGTELRASVPVGA